MVLVAMLSVASWPNPVVKRTFAKSRAGRSLLRWAQQMQE